jgi:hypothetical protein
LVLLLFEESPQIDTADGGSGGIKTIAHSDLFANLIDQCGRHVEGSGFAIDQDGNLKLRMKIPAIGAMAVGAAAGAFALDEGARQHVA